MTRKPRKKQALKKKSVAKALKKQPEQSVLEPENASFEQFSSTLKGRIISRFGQHVDVENEVGEITRCYIRRHLSSVVTGDWVMWRAALDPRQPGIVESILPRSKVLSRRTLRASEKVLAANIEQMILVLAVKPTFSRELIDSYLVAAEDLEIPAVIVLNKIDLLNPEGLDNMLHSLADYPTLGYPLQCVSTQSKEGIPTLTQCLFGKTSIVVGQSGVGKSSLVNILLPDADAATHPLSEHLDLGQHTTTAARLYHFREGGDLIDSPGVRGFTLSKLSAERLGWCFPELRPYLGHCRFSDCRHLQEPGCKLQEALIQEKISAARFNSYQNLLEKMGYS